MTTLSRPDLAQLRGDYRFQTDFVVDAAWRLQSMQDDNPLSPSAGCFHYSFWRDKTSEFADARFQEAGAALGLLSLPFFDSARTSGRLASADVLYRSFSAGLANLAAQQYPEGCYDEWYKGERGFAATEFTTIAYGLAARSLGDRLDQEDASLLRRVVARAGDWLSRRDDRVKANHQAAAAAALALAWEITGESRFAAAARTKLDDVLSRQHEEGWFPEVGGMDLGYCSVLLDYVMVYILVTGENAALPQMRKLMSFMLPMIHPDGTISAEMGICLNPYVSRLGVGLLSAHDRAAQTLTGLFHDQSSDTLSLRAYLADDLRLSRWSYLPLVAGLLADRFQPAGLGSRAMADAFPSGWTYYKAASVCACHGEELHVYFSPAGGGVVRIYSGSRLIGEDLGIHLDVGAQRLASSGYDSDRSVNQLQRGFAVSSQLGAAHFFQPTFLMRLVLRLGSSFALGSRFLRFLIDRRRIKQRTAVNQSAAPVARRGSGYFLERSVSVEGDRVLIVDRVTSERDAIDPASVQSMVRAAGEIRRLRIAPAVSAARELVFSKVFDLSAVDGVGFTSRVEQSPSAGVPRERS